MMDSQIQMNEHKAPEIPATNFDLNEDTLVSSHPFVAMGSDPRGAMVFGIPSPPINIQANQCVAVRAWIRSGIHMTMRGLFFIVTPDPKKQKSAKIETELESTEWLQQIALGVITLGEQVTAIKIGITVGFQTTIQLPGGRKANVDIENIWAEIHKVD
jgi:hypothetical protein